MLFVVPLGVTRYGAEIFGPLAVAPPPITFPVTVELGPVTHVGQAIVPLVVMVPPVIGPVVATLVMVPHGPPAS